MGVFFTRACFMMILLQCDAMNATPLMVTVDKRVLAF